MEIGVPKETKDQEFRVGLSPSSVRVLSENRHAIFVETRAGVGAGFTDDDYRQAGAQIVLTPEDAWNRELVVKVKEPRIPEYQFLQKGRCCLPTSIWQLTEA
jgi:alanine dehydrogenase